MASIQKAFWVARRSRRRTALAFIEMPIVVKAGKKVSQTLDAIQKRVAQIPIVTNGFVNIGGKALPTLSEALQWSTGIFAVDFFKHIFHGMLNKRKQAVGYHHESMIGKASIIPGTLTQCDRHGVYTARIIIDGVEKANHSSFFPKHWNRIDVTNAIKEAFEARVYKERNQYIGITADGMHIKMYLDPLGKIITAFPIHESLQ